MPLERDVVREGPGLHTGASCSVRLERAAGPVTIAVGDERAEMWRCPVVDVFRSTTIAVGKARVRTVEHLGAALHGLGISEGVRIVVNGPELPHLDGTAAAWVDALRELGLERDASSTAREWTSRIVRAATIDALGRSYAFAPALTPMISATLSLGDPRYDCRASWNGEPDSFTQTIANARTFAREEDVMELAAHGAAAWTPKETVVVLCKDRPAFYAGREFADDEPARHKLLDLIGDLYVRCGVLRGAVHADKPGHGATHEALTRALAEGVISLSAEE